MAQVKLWTGEVVEKADLDSPGIDCESADDGMTIQSEAAACDINNIMKLRERGVPIRVSDLIPQIGDFSNIPDFQTAMNLVVKAQQSFESLPARVRERFLNDPARFMAFCHDPKNKDEAVDLGLANKVIVAPPEPPRVDIVPPPGIPIPAPGAVPPKT